jgi:hypothetical protein
MAETVVRIEGMPHADLDDLISFLRAQAAGEYQVVARHDTEEGFREEPVTIAVALIAGTATAVKAIAKAISAWKVAREKTNRAAIARLEPGLKITIEEGGSYRVISLDKITRDGF